MVLETDSKQLGISTEPFTIIKDKEIQKRYIESPVEFNLNKDVEELYYNVDQYGGS